MNIEYKPHINGNGQVHGLVGKIMNSSAKLPNDLIAESAIENALVLSQYADSVKQMLYEIAEQEQRRVLDARTRTFENLYKDAVKACRKGNAGQYQYAMAVLMQHGRIVQQTVAKMHQIESLKGVLTNGNGGKK